MAIADTVEGTLRDGRLWFHYDLGNDVLYIRQADARNQATYGDEQDDGTLLLRLLADDSPVGLTVVNWWARYGTEPPSDSLRQIAAAVEPMSTMLSA